MGIRDTHTPKGVLEMKALVCALVGAGIVTLGSSAHGESPAWVPRAQQNRVEIAFDWMHRETPIDSKNVLTWDVTAQIGVSRHVYLDADIPWAAVVDAADYAPQTSVLALAGVPMLGAHFAARPTPHLGVFGGVGVGLPVLGTPVHLRTVLAQQAAAAARGDQDAYRFVPQHVPIVLRGGVELRYGLFVGRADAAPSFLIGFGGCADPGGALGNVLDPVVFCSGTPRSFVYLDLRTDAGVQAPFGLEGGLRVRMHFELTDAWDRAQIALEPFVGYESPLSRGVFARYGLLVPLDVDQPVLLGIPDRATRALTHLFEIGAKF